MGEEFLELNQNKILALLVVGSVSFSILILEASKYQANDIVY